MRLDRGAICRLLIATTTAGRSTSDNTKLRSRRDSIRSILPAGCMQPPMPKRGAWSEYRSTAAGPETHRKPHMPTCALTSGRSCFGRLWLHSLRRGFQPRRRHLLCFHRRYAARYPESTVSRASCSCLFVLCPFVPSPYSAFIIGVRRLGP